MTETDYIVSMPKVVSLTGLCHEVLFHPDKMQNQKIWLHSIEAGL